jgi:hypothetical protein
MITIDKTKEFKAKCGTVIKHKDLLQNDKGKLFTVINQKGKLYIKDCDGFLYDLKPNIVNELIII